MTTNNRIGTEDPDFHHGRLLKLNKFVAAIRVLQILIAVTILGLAGFVVTFITYSGASLELFTASATILLLLYVLISTHHFTTIHNFWAVACIDVFLAIFWFVAFIVTSTQVAGNRRNSYYYCGGLYYCRRDLLELEGRDEGLEKRATTTWSTFRAVMISAAVLGAVEFILFVLTFFFTVAQILHHKNEGGHNNAKANLNATGKPMEMQTPLTAQPGQPQTNMGPQYSARETTNEPHSTGAPVIGTDSNAYTNVPIQGNPNVQSNAV